MRRGSRKGKEGLENCSNIDDILCSISRFIVKYWSRTYLLLATPDAVLCIDHIQDDGF